MKKSEKIEQLPKQLNNETLERIIEILTERVENLEERLALVERVTLEQPTTLGVVPTTGQYRPRRKYPIDPFHGLFGYYFVTGTLLLVFLGVTLTLSSSEFLKVSWWFSAISLTLFQMVFIVLGVWQKDRRTVMNAAVGLLLAVLIDIGVIQFIGVAPLQEFFLLNG